ncbi:[FeFe] hydrogenase H-cluster radical SAM maturase HydE [Patescibacteria group bacterium]
MCLTIPAKVIEIRDQKAIIDKDGQKFEIDIRSLDLLNVGDWVLYMSDIAVQKVSADDAKEILELLEHVQKTDPDKLNKRFIETVKASKKRKLKQEEIEYLLNINGPELEALFSEAEMMRKTYIKDFFCIHGIIEFSNYCVNDCNYCGLCCENTAIRRYRMTDNEIIEAVGNAADKGYKLFVLQSGEDPYYTKEKLVNLIGRIKEKHKVFVFISIGERDFDTYKALKDARADGVLFRFETSNPQLFAKIHNSVLSTSSVPGTHKSLKTRFEHLKFMKELGYFIASGSIVGLPGQTIADLAQDIITIRDNEFDMVSMGPFVPCQNTPFAKEKPGSTDIMLKMIAILRLEMKDTRIPVVTAHETLDPEKGRKKAIKAGANAMMFNITPEKYQPHYEIYKRKEALDREMWEKYGLYNSEESYKMLEEKLRIG